MRKVGIALSAFALAVTLGACGGNDGGGDSTESAQLAALTESIADRTSAASSAHMTFTADAAGQQITGQGALRFDAGTAMVMDMSAASGTVSIVSLDRVVYLKLPQELKPGKPWLKISPNDKSRLARSLGGLNEELSKNADPRVALKGLERVGTITARKDETLEGRKVTHYTITVDVHKIADSQADQKAKQAIRKAIRAGMTDFPVDVWVDESGLPTRVALQAPTPNGTGGVVPVSMRVDYTAWGTPVQIAAPPEDQTTAPPS